MKINRKIQKNNFKKAILAIAVVFLFFNSFNVFSVKAASNAAILNISVSAGRTTALPGQDIVYTITYKNTGTVPVTGIIIRNPFAGLNQNYLEFVSANPVPDSGSDTWIIDGPLQPGESGKIAINAKISTAVPSNRLTIRNRASIDSNEIIVKYSSYTSFAVVSNCRLTVNQTVRNVTDNSLFRDSIDAQPGDEVEFLMEIESVGTNQALNTKIWDRLSSRLKYIDGSATMDGSSLSDKIIDDGIYVGDLLIGAQKNIKFRAVVDSSARFYTGKNYLRSYGYADADVCVMRSGTAAVIVNIKKTTSLGVLAFSGLTIFKSARNITQKSRNWSNSVVYAEPGDEIEFLIKIKSTEEGVNSVRVEDLLPPKMYYISDSTTVDGIYQSDGITTKNVYIPYVYRNIIKEIKFRVKLAGESSFNIYPISLVNEASAWGNDGKEISDTVKIIVTPLSQSSIKDAGIGSEKDDQDSDNQDSGVGNDSGEVKGAATVKTGFNYLKLFLIFFVSLIMTTIVYFYIREEKLLKMINDKNISGFRKSIIETYFKTKLFLKIKFLRLKR